MDKVNDLISKVSKSGQSYSPEEAQRLTAQLRVDSYNSSTGEQTGYDCPKCKNRGNFAVLSDDASSHFMRDCSCMKIRNCIKKMKRSGLNDVIRKYTFEAYNCTEDWQKTIRAKAEAYATNPQGWFLLCGQSGAGKSHLCTAICRKFLLDEREVIYMPWREDIAALKSFSTDSEDRRKLLQSLKNAEILYIDDLFKNGKDKDGSAPPTRADIDLAFEIINYRYNKQLLTIISTERSPQELLDIDQATGGRIAERAAEYLLHIGQDVGKNYRLRNVVTL